MHKRICKCSEKRAKKILKIKVGGNIFCIFEEFIKMIMDYMVLYGVIVAKRRRFYEC
jgi:hypothetical protein